MKVFNACAFVQKLSASFLPGRVASPNLRFLQKAVAVTPEKIQ